MNRAHDTELNFCMFGMGHRLLIYAFFMLSGAVASWYMIPETLGKSLEELSNEEQTNFIGSAYFLFVFCGLVRTDGTDRP